MLQRVPLEAQGCKASSISTLMLSCKPGNVLCAPMWGCLCCSFADGDLPYSHSSHLPPLGFLYHWTFQRSQGNCKGMLTHEQKAGSKTVVKIHQVGKKPTHKESLQGLEISQHMSKTSPCKGKFLYLLVHEIA